jgi:hypothetical protein
MSAKTPDSLLSAPTDRRPAIWPWLVMPLVTLILYYGLDRLIRDYQEDQGAYNPAPQAQAPATASNTDESDSR